MKLGTAWADVTPSEPIAICGQMCHRLGEYTHDPLTVNAVALKWNDTRVVLISCDFIYLPEVFIRNVQVSCEQDTGIPASSVIIACTHTHLAPYTETWIIGETDQAFMNTLHESLVDITRRSLKDLEEVELYAGSGWLDQMGFNRRGLYGNGKAAMYYGSWNEDFEGVEGPRDGEVGVLFARKLNGDVKAIVTSFSTHPNSLEMESFYSADLVGAVRRFLRNNLGNDVGVVYLTGAAGNTGPSKLDDNKNDEMPWRGEEGWMRSGLYLGSEILKTIAGTTKPMSNPVLDLAQADVEIPVRPWPELFDPGKMADKGFRDYYTQAHECWSQILQEESPVSVRINALRVGDAIICTNPAELFVEFGLQIKKESPTAVTLIAELSDGYVGYVPTEEAFERGGYCTLPARTSLLDRCAGEVIVDTTRHLMGEAFSK